MRRGANLRIDARPVNLPLPESLLRLAVVEEGWRGSKKPSVSPLIQALMFARVMIRNLGSGHR
jgi:hypothetical protein